MRSRRRPAVAVGVLAALAALTLSACASAPDAMTPAGGTATGGKALAKGDWPQYHRDAGHSGVATAMPTVHRAKLLKKIKLDGDVYASPIVVHGDTIVATENNTVYAFGPKYHQLWKRHVGSPSPSQQRACGDITPLGMTGTPVYSTASGLVYVVAELGGDVRHQLYAMNPRTGTIAWHRSVDLPGVSARDMQQRGALAIAHGKVWVSYGAQAGDCGNYKGRVVGVGLNGKGVVSYTPPTKRGGGIWNAAGPTLGLDGDLLVVSANGAGFPGDRYDHTNSVLRINGKGHLVDSFAPTHWARFNQEDLGLGSQGVALVGSTWAVLGGKSGQVYVLRRNHLGGIGGQVSTKTICPSYGGAAVQGSTLYLPCTDGVRAVSVDSHGKLHVRWHVSSSSLQGSPVIGGGRVWALDASDGLLYGLAPATGRTREKVSVGTTSRFATPAIHGRDVLVPTLAGLSIVRTS